MQRLSQLTSPALAGVVKEKSAEAAIAEIKRCTESGAAMIDLHLPCLLQNDEATLREIISASSLPVLALHYNVTYDGESAGHSEEERVDLLLRAVRAGAAGIDMQGYTFHRPSKKGFCGEDIYSFTKGDPKEIVTDGAVIAAQCDLIDRVHAMGAEVLLSCHPDIPMSATQVVELALFLEQRRPDIVKIVTRANSEEDMLEALRAMLWLRREVRTPVAYHAAGAAGRLTRILNPVLGGHIAFCVDHYNEASVREQPLLRVARGIVDGIKRSCEE